MANKTKSKGTTLLVSISAVYTAVPNLISLSTSDEGNETYESRTLDGSAYMTYDPTGYVRPCKIAAEFFRDPDDTTHQYVLALIPLTAANNWKITYADPTPLSEIYSGASVTWGNVAAMADGLRTAIEIQTSGART